MAKFVSLLLLALLGISFVATMVMAREESQYHLDGRNYGPGSLKAYRYYGNKAVCPCYNNWKTKEGGPKCP
ncbi:Gibberellin regulated protein [Corchorus capsularis]|uniref:Gibberellin regulated protein n=1 Tax=Corchorus capsularis TaxID=210143 RepID=A0A1R3JMC4_COCAP|nr:Gibberellin regulated protein [Corchorus capsularis]